VSVRLGVAAAVAAVLCAGGDARAGGEAAEVQPVPPAGPSVVVLRLDATAGVDGGLIDRVQHEVEARAERSGLVVTTGAANLTDTAALAGCTTKVAADCNLQILDALGADELVYGTVDRSMSGHRVTLARATRNGAPVEVTVDVPAGNLDSAVRAIQPGLDKLFPAGGASPDPGTSGGTGDDAGTATGTGDPAGTGMGGTAGTEGTRLEGTGRGDAGIDMRKAVLIGGLAVGGALLVVGVLQWNEASSLQGDIDAAPDQTPSEIAALLALEDRAQGYATRGNWLTIAGLAIAGGTGAWWYFTRDRSAPAPTTARLRPWVSPTGGGVTLSWGLP